MAQKITFTKLKANHTKAHENNKFLTDGKSIEKILPLYLFLSMHGTKHSEFISKMFQICLQ